MPVDEQARILIYSHDSFGLGHLRRCRAIAHALVEEFKDLSVLILSGSPIIGSFDFRSRVDFVRIPGVIKLRNGEYTSLGLHIDLEQTLAMRSSIIEHTARVFQPHVFIVDKEPLGLRGEVGRTLGILKHQGACNVLGLRDVMDDAKDLRLEWRRKKVEPALRRLYDEIWIYGIPEMGNPLQGLGLSKNILSKACFTGYLPRKVLEHYPDSLTMPVMDKPYILVTPGGGGDGADLIDWVLRAYESTAELPCDALVVCGPFLPPNKRKAFHQRATALSRVQLLTFDAHIETLMEKAEGVVAMGGYNTFCEILSLNKRALLLPRSTPRKEQLIRARCAQNLGFIRMLSTDGNRPVVTMVNALRGVPDQTLPADVQIPGVLDGLDNVIKRVRPVLQRSRIIDATRVNA